MKLFGPEAGIYAVPAAGGIPRALAGDPSERGARAFPRFLPDGRHYLVLMQALTVDERRICVASVDGGELDCLASCHSQAEYSSSVHSVVRGWTLVALPFDVRSRKLTGEAVPVAREVRWFGPERRRGLRRLGRRQHARLRAAPPTFAARLGRPQRSPDVGGRRAERIRPLSARARRATGGGRHRHARRPQPGAVDSRHDDRRGEPRDLRKARRPRRRVVARRQAPRLWALRGRPARRGRPRARRNRPRTGAAEGPGRPGAEALVARRPPDRVRGLLDRPPRPAPALVARPGRDDPPRHERAGEQLQRPLLAGWARARLCLGRIGPTRGLRRSACRGPFPPGSRAQAAYCRAGEATDGSCSSCSPTA